jgi:tRNA-dependent cyclodipeptide synthase
MRIEKYLNTTKKEVEEKIFNIFYGFSLGNKYFTPDNIRSYLTWALENTKDKIIVLIPDKIQAVNYEVKNGYSPTRALAVALRKGAEIETIVKYVIEELKIPDSKIRILHWQDIEDASYKRMFKVIMTAFEQNSRFRETVIKMVKETSHFNNLNLQDNQYQKLAQYIIDELPILISGLNLDGVHYGLFPYPGFANLDYLALDLQEGKSFPEVTSQLEIHNTLKLIELYID